METPDVWLGGSFVAGTSQNWSEDLSQQGLLWRRTASSPVAHTPGAVEVQGASQNGQGAEQRSREDQEHEGPNTKRLEEERTEVGRQ